MSDTYGYLGTQDPSSTLDNLSSLTYLIERIVHRMSTATVCKVVRAPYDASGNAITPGSAVAIGYVDVQPLVSQIDGYNQATPHGTVYHLSYHRYQSALGAVIADPVVGDIGKMVVAERDTSAVKATNGPANPGSRRAYDKADGTYFGCTQSAGAPSQYMTFTGNGITIVDKNNNSITMNDSGITIQDKNNNSIVTSSSGITLTDGNGNIISTGSGGITLTVKGGNKVQVTGGGTVQAVELSDSTAAVVLESQ